jgi:hypothetical protein
MFMSRSDKFEDQYEGTFSEPTFEEIKVRQTILIFYNTTKLIEKSSN